MFISIYQVGRLCFPILVTQCCVGDSLWSSAVYYPLITRSINIYSRDVPYGDSMGPSVVEGLITVNTLVGGATHWSIWLSSTASCSDCWPANGQGWFLEQLTACAGVPDAKASLLEDSKPLALIGWR